MKQSLCDKHRRSKGYYVKSLKGDVKVSDNDSAIAEQREYYLVEIEKYHRTANTIN